MVRHMGPNEQEVREIYRRGEVECAAWILRAFGQMYERIESQDSRIEAQDKRIEEMERQVKGNSNNSSTPLLQDPFGGKKAKKRQGYTTDTGARTRSGPQLA